MTKTPFHFWVLAGTNLFIMMGFGLVGPVLPLYAESFEVSYTSVGFLIALFPAVRVLTNLPSGLLGARLGERKACSAGAGFVACGALISGSAPDFSWLIVGQSLQGLGSSFFHTNSMSYIIRITPPERMGKTMSIYQASFSTGVSIGPVVGGLLAGVGGFRLPFYTYGGLAALGAILTWTFLRIPPAEPGGPKRAGLLSQGREIRRLFGNFEYVMALFLTSAIFFLRSGARHTTLPLYARDAAGLDPLSIGLLLSSITVMNLVALWPAGRAVDRSRKAVAIGGNLAAALAVVAFGWADTFTGLILVSAIFGVTTGICGVPPSVIASDVMPARVRSAGIGIFRMAGDIGFIIGPIISGLTITHAGYRWTFAAHAAGVLIVGLMAIKMKETLKPRAPVPTEPEAVESFVAERTGGMPS
ncbi:MAG TPA: MFS transporter [Nitrospinota bacterium]|nr:MFS transporter [Nitrospinota bacterium]